MDEAFDYLLAVARNTEKFVRRRGGHLNLPICSLQSALMRFINLRSMKPLSSIQATPAHDKKPIGWTDHHEMVWNEWFNFYFSYDDWIREVMTPVFGTGEHIWEPEEWRTEIFLFLQGWIQRSLAIVEQFDATQLEEEDEDADDSIDPYLIENGLLKSRMHLAQKVVSKEELNGVFRS
jgi:hypothetical protein